MIRILIIKPDTKPFVEDIDGSLESMQKVVGGYIQAVYPFDDNVVLVCNEEGKILDLPPNRPLKNNEGEITDMICGDFFIAGEGEEDFVSISDEQIDEYTKIFDVHGRHQDIILNKQADELSGKDKNNQQER